ncbi:MAG: hypothetical protein KAH86_03445 [Methanosarcinales archaeon]|nr:hypothetical protein [Methanosarcinales archaeon]
MIPPQTTHLVTDAIEVYQQHLKDPLNILYRERFVEICKHIAITSLHSDYFVPPTVNQMAYVPYEGGGILSINKTMMEFCNTGRSMNSIIAKTRLRSFKNLNVAILLDNTTGHDNQLSEILSKIMVISFLEGVRGNADAIDVIPFDCEAYGPYNLHQYKYDNVMTGKPSDKWCGLDLALAKLLQIGWDEREGEKHIIILTRGPPVSGRNNLLEDIYAQEMTLKYIQRLVKKRVKVLYIPFFAEGDRIGAYSAQSFADHIQHMGLTASEVTDESMLMDAMYNGVKNMLQEQG